MSSPRSSSIFFFINERQPQQIARSSWGEYQKNHAELIDSSIVHAIGNGRKRDRSKHEKRKKYVMKIN